MWIKLAFTFYSIKKMHVMFCSTMSISSFGVKFIIQPCEVLVCNSNVLLLCIVLKIKKLPLCIISKLKRRFTSNFMDNIHRCVIHDLILIAFYQGFFLLLICVINKVHEKVYSQLGY